MASKKVTIENLAMMIKKGFDDTATKAQVGVLEKRFDKVDIRLNKIDVRLLKIENIILRHHESQIESLEKRILRLEGVSSIS